jgi:predicted P-loop ATPase
MVTSPLDREIWVTTFNGLSGSRTSRTSKLMSLRSLIPRLRDTEAAVKEQLPLIKLAQFGDRVTKKGSVRFDANVHEVWGIEGDYDGEHCSPDELADALRRNSIAGLVVTSPSHTPAAPRARILLPFSKPLPPKDRARMISRLAGILPDRLGPESWTLSQAYFCGKLTDAADHRVLEVDGDYIDERDDLDATALPPQPRAKTNGKQSPRPKLNLEADGETHQGNGVDVSPFLPVDVTTCLDAIAAGEGSHHALLQVVGRWIGIGLPQADIVAVLTSALLRRPESEQDTGWHTALADLPRLVRGIAEKEAEAAAAAAAGGSGGGQTPPPHPPGAGPGAGPGPSTPPPQPQAQTQPLPLLTRKHGKWPGNAENAMTLLRQAPELMGCFAFDEMLCKVVIRKPLPWMVSLPVIRPSTDVDASNLQGWLQRHCRLSIGNTTTHQAIDTVATENSFHPVRDFLRAEPWDGIVRMDTWLSDYAGAEESDYTRRIGRMFLLGMVARVERPGCKFDYCMILEGPQGILKSQFLRELGTPWFSDQLPDVRHGGKDAAQHMRGLWLIELAELDVMGRADVLAFNAFLTRSVEIYRPSYGRKEVNEPRQCVFAGTTNRDQYLRDHTGARRFWVIPTQSVDPVGLRGARQQLFAEALAAYQAGERFWPDLEFERDVIRPQQDQRYVGDAWEDPIREYVRKLTRTTVMLIAQGAFGLEAKDVIRLTPSDQHRITAILQRLRWKPRRTDTARWWEAPTPTAGGTTTP